jgi:hypothetical protein
MNTESALRMHVNQTYIEAAQFCASFRELIESGSIKTIRLPARSPNLNSFAERWVRSVRKVAVRCRERLGGLLKYYEREAA